MAGGAIVSVTKGKDYPGKLTGKVFLTCFLAATGGLIFGYDLGISGGVTSMDSFLEKFFPSVYEKESTIKPSDNQYCKFNSQTLTLFTSSLYLAALVSASGSSPMTRAFGRRRTMMLGGILFAVGGALNGAAEHLWMLIVGRVLLGLGIGCCNQSVPIYLSEVAPCRYRGAFNMLFQLSITIGILIANLLNYYFAKIHGGWGWRLSLGGAVVPALIIILGSFGLPESPNSLIERNMPEEAKAQLIRLRGVSNVDEEFNDLVAASEASKKVKHPWATIVKRRYRPQLVMSFCIPMFQQLTGMNVIIFYAPVLFKTIGFGATASLMSALITGIVNCLATLVSIATVDKVGRRFLFIEGAVQMWCCQVIMAALIGHKFGWSGNPGVLGKGYASLVVAIICVYVGGFAWSWGPLGWLVPSEIFPLEIRSAAQSINVMVNMIFTFAIAQIFTWMLCHFKYFLFVFFAICVMVAGTFIYKLLPETKGIPIEEMGAVWMSHPHWSKCYDEDKKNNTSTMATTLELSTKKDDGSA